MTEPLHALELSYNEWTDAVTRRWDLPRYRADQLANGSTRRKFSTSTE